MTLTWPRPELFPALPEAGVVHVWAATLEPPAAVVKTLRSLLTPDETERADRFHFDRDRNHYVAGRGAVRTVLGRYLDVVPEDVRFEYGPQDKPHLSPVHGSDLTFNLSHSGTCLLLAVGIGADLGVDVEQLRPLDDAAEIAERFFSESEVRAFRAVPEGRRIEGFFNCWTRKEAFVKAVGQGISLTLSAFDVSLTPGRPARLHAVRPGDIHVDAHHDAPSDPSAWSLVHLVPAPGYTGALMVRHPAADVRCFQYTHEEG